MWSVDQNRCVNVCPKMDTCPDRKVISRALRKLQDDLEETPGGSRAGMIVVVCRDMDLDTPKS